MLLKPASGYPEGGPRALRPRPGYAQRMAKLPSQRPQAGTPFLYLVSDDVEHCPYRPGQEARCPRYRPFGELGPRQLDVLLEAGFQRVGTALFRTACPMCRSCEPVRVPVADFQRSRSQARVWRRNQDLRVTLERPGMSHERVALWNRHRIQRGLLMSEADQDPRVYAGWLAESCAQTVEVRYHIGRRLVAVSLLDLGERAANSAYHYFDPEFERRSLGVYSVLYEIELCRERKIDLYYLGLWASDAPALRYKSNYYPHERLIGNTWTRFSQPEDWGVPAPWSEPHLPVAPVALKLE